MIDWLLRTGRADPQVEVAGRVLPVVLRRTAQAKRFGDLGLPPASLLNQPAKRQHKVGAKRQIRVMFEQLGYQVTKLLRVRIGNVKLGHLKPGQWRNLTDAELKGLLPERTEW